MKDVQQVRLCMLISICPVSHDNHFLFPCCYAYLSMCSSCVLLAAATAPGRSFILLFDSILFLLCCIYGLIHSCRCVCAWYVCFVSWAVVLWVLCLFYCILYWWILLFSISFVCVKFRCSCRRWGQRRSHCMSRSKEIWKLDGSTFGLFWTNSGA